MADESLSMDIEETVEISYLVEEFSDTAINIDQEPNPGSTSINYIQEQYGVFDPPETGIYKLSINGETIKITVTDIYRDLIHQWKLDEGSGTTLNDNIGDKNIGIGTGSWSSDSSSVSGNRVRWQNGEFSEVVTPIDSINSSQGGSYAFIATVEIKGNIGNNKAFIDHLESNSNGFTMGHRDNEIGVRNYSNTNQSASANQDTRYRVVGQMDSGNLEIFINGQNKSSQTNDQSPNNGGTSGFALGGQTTDDNNDADVYLDNVMVFDNSLTLSQIEKDFNRQPWT